MNKIILAAAALFVGGAFTACKNGIGGKETHTTPGGLRYSVERKGNGKKIEMENVVKFHEYLLNDKDSMLLTSRLTGQPSTIQVKKSTHAGDLLEIFPLLTGGDSVIVYIPADTLAARGGGQLPPGIAPGSTVHYALVIESVLTPEEADKEAMEGQKKQMEQAAQQKVKDVEELQAYFASKGLKPMEKNGVYYTIEKKGTGKKAKTGELVSAEYKGMLLNGLSFDESTPERGPIKFAVGSGQVIQGWDIIFQELPVGTEATVYIPSTLAYGVRSMPAQPGKETGIPANSNLMFKVKLVSVEPAGAPAH